jgi:predicted MPP superfamily phosphohydrolase
MIFSLGPFVLYFVLLFRLVIFSRLAVWAKILAGLILLPLSLPFAMNRLLLGSGAAPELPGWVLRIQGWCFFTLILLLVLFLFYDGFRLFKKMFRAPKSFSMGRRKAMLVMLAAVPATYGLKRAVDVPEVRKMEVTLPRLPKELDGLTLVQISDLHASALLQGEWVEQVMERANALKPDLVVFTGDMVDGLPAKLVKSLAPLTKIISRFGVYACVGNHEYYSNYSAWLKAFSGLGINMLINSHALIKVNNHQLVLAGLSDMVAANYGHAVPDLNKALAGAPEKAVRILLDHRPNSAFTNAKSGIDLQLSGHTHGGQIVGMNQIVGRMNQGFLYGWYKVNNMPLYVSSGAGLWAGFPIRIGVPSEIAHIVLRAAV